MENVLPIKNALISVFHKDGIDVIIKKLTDLGVQIISTGGTKQYIEQLGYKATSVETITQYPSLFGGRVKTLHPAIMGGILFKRNAENDLLDCQQFHIPQIDLVIVDLYPFDKTLQQTTDENEIIEKIDIGGISLIRAAAKNYKDVLVIPSQKQYDFLINLLEQYGANSTIEHRKAMAAKAFEITTLYDYSIYSYFQQIPNFDITLSPIHKLRYGENPHQQGWFLGNFSDLFEKIQGQEISYNNILDIDAAMHLISEFDEPTAAIIKHTNACGVASHSSPLLAWKKAFEADPQSAFGGIIITNFPITVDIAQEINSLFFEILIAPYFEQDAIKILSAKTKRIILRVINWQPPKFIIKKALNGMLIQENNLYKQYNETFKIVTNKQPSDNELSDLLFANKIVKHTKSNAIVIVKNKQLLGNGIGQTSRVDAVKQAIEKAKSHQFDLHGAVLASDAFFPFKDSVEIASNAGIISFIQPGGSIRDNESIEFCNVNNLSMIFTGIRHFKH
ncbi:MAG: bifunctional phosphoribosylaminoimidazolecarboxamide formyltransferase/IMP cyclohydrolase [Bacteroidales bacterium]|nr:bifunctional phosphoribosylaminoimidazolecarboxamide formyltransferase/IMP cyclohydrolase [Bacteroidales bacterium]